MRRPWIFFSVLLVVWCLNANIALGKSNTSVQSTPEERFLQGYIQALIERELGWPDDTYRLDIRGTEVTMAITEKSPQKRAEAIALLSDVPYLTKLDVYVTTTAALAGETTLPRALTARERFLLSLGVPPDELALPQDRLFYPLVGDPKQVHFFVSAQKYQEQCSSDLARRCFDDTMGIVAFGESFGIYRQPGERAGDGVQVGVSGGMFAQFQLSNTDSNDMVMADYLIGVPVTYRRGNYSARYMLYHQNSHLGDEFLLRNGGARVDLSFEGFETIHSIDRGRMRFYGGGEYLFRRSPAALEPFALHAGLEFRTMSTLMGAIGWLGAVDIKSWQEHNFDPSVNVEIGLDFGGTSKNARRLRLMAQGYYGFSPYGQLYDIKVSYFGAKLSFGF